MKASNPKNNQRLSALTSLEKQLVAGTKPAKVEGRTTRDLVPLTDSDRDRITKEIGILKSRIV
jgi:hypothetical protein